MNPFKHVFERTRFVTRLFALLTSVTIFFSSALLIGVLQSQMAKTESSITKAYAYENRMKSSIASTETLEAANEGTVEYGVLAQRIEKLEAGVEDIRELLRYTPEAAITIANMKKDIQVLVKNIGDVHGKIDDKFDSIQFIIVVTYPIIFGWLIAFTVGIIGSLRKK